jgi:hypothetical protein
MVGTNIRRGDDKVKKKEEFIEEINVNSLKVTFPLNSHKIIRKLWKSDLFVVLQGLTGLLSCIPL